MWPRATVRSAGSHSALVSAIHPPVSTSSSHRSSVAISVPPTPATRPEDVPLHDDVRWLAAALGRVIERLEGEDALEIVDGLRQAARARRRGDPEAPHLVELLALVETLPPEECALAARAFTLFFLLINTAEQVHRVRRRADYRQQDAPGPQPASARWTMRQLREQGRSAEEVAQAIGRLDVLLVNNAPTT